MQITKLEAVKRQLKTAVELYFANGDPVSIHTLVGASYQILHDLNSKTDGPAMIVKEQFLKNLDPNEVPEFKSKLNEAQNFFKHADRDANGVLAFNANQAEMLLADACAKYQQLSGEIVPELGAYSIWFLLETTKIFNVPPLIEQFRQWFKQNLPYSDKKSFFKTVRAVIANRPDWLTKH